MDKVSHKKSDMFILRVPNLNKTDFSGIFTFYELMMNFTEIPRQGINEMIWRSLLR